MGNAGVTFREPVPNDYFAETKEEAYAAMLKEAHQKHALISGDVTASGEARIQALADFIMDVQNTKSMIDKAGVWLLERVAELLGSASQELIERSKVHDDSKLKSPEKELFDELTPKLKGSTFGSEEYSQFLEELKPAWIIITSTIPTIQSIMRMG